MASVQFRLNTLGRLCLTDASDQIVASGGKHLLLLAYLARSAPRPIRREVLATLLWGDRNETRARQSLRQALLRLKRELRGCLRVSPDVVTVECVELDIEAFEADVDAGRLSQAVARWRGDFLVEQEDVGSEEYRAWIEGERAVLQRRLVWSLARLVDDATERRAHQEALQFATLWSELLPLDDVARARRAAAWRQTEPTSDASHATVRPPELVGRDAQLSALESVWSRIDDAGGVVVIEGEQGIGKSAFAREFIRRRQQQSAALILDAAAHSNDGEPLAIARLFLSGLRRARGLSGASDHALAALSAVVPSLRERFPHLPADTTFELGTALHEVLCAVSEEAPVLIVIDDFDCADARSQQLVCELIRRVPPRTMVVLTAQRGWFDRSGRTTDIANLRVVKLLPLVRAEIADLIASMVLLTPAARDELASELAAATDGNPFYIAALVSSYADSGRLCAAGTAGWVLQQNPRRAQVIPPRVRDAVRAHLAQLGDDARALLDVLAILDEPVAADTLERIAQALHINPATAVPELLAAGIIEVPNGVSAYRFSKGVFRHAVAESVGPALRNRIEVAAATPRRRPYARIAVATLLIAGCMAGAVTWLDDDSAASAGAPQRLAVVAFQNETGLQELDPVGRIAAEYLTQGIATATLVKVAPPILGRGIADSARGSGAASARAEAAEGGADLVISGSYYRDGDSIRFHSRTTETRTGRVVFALQSVRTPIGNPVAGIEPLLEKNLAALGPLVQRRLSATATLLAPPPSYAAYREFEQGLDYIYQRRGGDALFHLQRAAAMDTSWHVPLLYMASVYASQVQLPELDSMLTHILIPRRSRFTPFERANLDALIAKVRGDAPGLFAAARAGAAIAPNSVLATVDLPLVAINLNLPGESLEILTSSSDRAESEDLPAYYLALSSALHMLGKYEQQLDVAQTLQSRLPAEYRAVFYQGRALAAMGRMKELDAVLHRGLQLPIDPNWGPHGMRMYVAISDELRAHGYPEKARQVLERAVQFYGGAPPEVQSTAKFRFDFAQALYRLGRLPEARAIFEDLLARGNVPGVPDLILHAHIGYVAVRQADQQTVHRIDQLLKNARHPFVFGQATLYRAALQALLGNREAAVRLLNQSVAEGTYYEAGTHTLFEFNSLQGYPPYEEWIRPKG